MAKDLVPAGDALAPQLNPFFASEGLLIVVAFASSSSKNYSLAVAIAKVADAYGKWSPDQSPLHVAGFAATATGAARAYSLLRYVSGWKGTLVFSRGAIVENLNKLLYVLSCYSESCRCRDFRAHCHEVIDDPTIRRNFGMSMSFVFDLSEQRRSKKHVVVDRYLFPCKRIAPRSVFDGDHTSSPADLIQAAGVSNGCDICPRFNPDAYRKVGTVTYEVDE